MAGDEGGGYSKWTNIYGDDPNKYKGFWKYYNTETPFGRAKCAQINLSATFLIGFGIYYWIKSKKNKEEK